MSSTTRCAWTCAPTVRSSASGSLAELRRWTRSLTVERADERTLHVRAWIPAGTDDTVGRRVAVKLELDAKLVKSGRR